MGLGVAPEKDREHGGDESTSDHVGLLGLRLKLSSVDGAIVATESTDLLAENALAALDGLTKHLQKLQDEAVRDIATSVLRICNVFTRAVAKLIRCCL